MFKPLARFRDLLRTLSAARGRSESPAPPESLGEPDDGEFDPGNPFPEIIQLEIRDVIDLHSIPPRDVRRVVEEYLREARERRFRSVRIIHGKGVGVQREAVRNILAATTFVRAYTDAPPEAGGWGATVAHFTDDEAEVD